MIDSLEWPFDFEICEPYLLSDEWPISLSDALIVLAKDGSGGVYTIVDKFDPDESMVIYLSSEGQAGQVASNLEEFLSIIVALPYWHDLLKFSAGGELEEMRKAAPLLENVLLDDDPEIVSKQESIARSLDLPFLEDPLQTLASSARSHLAIEIRANDGAHYESLFNTYSVSDLQSSHH